VGDSSFAIWELEQIDIAMMTGITIINGEMCFLCIGVYGVKGSL